MIKFVVVRCVLSSSTCNKIPLLSGLSPGPLGELTTLPRPQPAAARGTHLPILLSLSVSISVSLPLALECHHPLWQVYAPVCSLHGGRSVHHRSFHHWLIHHGRFITWTVHHTVNSTPVDSSQKLLYSAVIVFNISFSKVCDT